MEEKQYLKGKNFVLANEVKKESLIHLCLAGFIILWLNCGLFSYIQDYIHDFFKLLVFAVWFAIASMKKHYFNLLLCSIWPLLVFYGILIISSWYSDYYLINTWIVNLRYLFIVYSLFLYYFDYTRVKQRRQLLWLITLDYIYIFIYTLIYLNIYPDIVRYKSTSQEVFLQFYSHVTLYGLGNYGHYFSLVAVSAPLLYSIQTKKKHTLFKILLYIFIFYLLIKGQFMIATLSYFLILIQMLLLKKENNKVNIMIIFPTILLVLTILYLFGCDIFMFLAHIQNMPYFIAVRLEEIGVFLSGNVYAETDIAARFSRYNDSIQGFLSNILWGTFGNGGVGRHSTILDILGMYGFLSLPYFHFLLKAYKYTVRGLLGSVKSIIYALWGFFIVFSTINNVLFSTIFISMFIYVPLIAKTISEKRREIHNEDIMAM